MDPFGDGSFLAYFDLGMAIQKRNMQSAASTSQSRIKRTKVTPSPTELSATFRPNSSFSIGNKVDPSEFENLPDLIPSASTLPQESIPDLNPSAPTLSQTEAPSVAPVLTQALEQTLRSYYGHSKFRPGQLDVIRTVLDQRDAAVFWATGSGKSLCYQIPALHTGQVGIVVSPLISLMEDQAHKLNGLCDRRLATFLGSGQTEMKEEEKALNGDYPLVYVTPEKLLSDGFLDQLAFLHRNNRRLSLFAIDESHCVSEWGHDFRPQYRKLDMIRSHPVLQEVPILALTATAIPRVQEDIQSSLQLRQPFLARQTIDRDNLEIKVSRRHKGGMRATLDPFLKDLDKKDATIIYAPTRSQVDEITSYLQSKLNVDVRAYHAGLTNAQRTEAHNQFLVGQTPIIVATVAFGMGIDKPDTRRVWHYGPPKTMEEYYQQIGRAGRDGRPAECLMFVSDSDFDQYKSDFYMGGLPSAARKAVEQSLSSLKTFAFDVEGCRRRKLLEFFNEEPSYERCGTCDNCKSQKKYEGDLERDMGAYGARIVLMAIGSLNDQGMSTIEKIIGGNTVDDFRYAAGCSPKEVQESIKTARKALGKRRSVSFFREMIAPLVNKGYISEDTKKAKVRSFMRSWTVYKLTNLGMQALRDESIPIMLPVSEAFRDIEKKEEEKREKTLASLASAGVNLEQIPKEEVEIGDGETIRAFTKWNCYMENLRRHNRGTRIGQLENLRSRIEKWRSDTALKNRMAPAAVMAEHIVVLIVYTVATLKRGLKVEREALYAAGVRSRELDGLVVVVNEWIDEFQQRIGPVSAGSTMVLPDEPFQPPKRWDYAVYKPNRTTKMASWESSYNRFAAGEHPQTIAIAPANGRPIQVTTVAGHILDALTHGHSVPLKRLAETYEPPNKDEWEQLVDAETVSRMGVVADPENCDGDGNKFTTTKFLAPILGEEFVTTPYESRTPAQRAQFAKWCQHLRWFSALRRVGFEPTFQ